MVQKHHLIIINGILAYFYSIHIKLIEGWTNATE
jgi:hypothetical protein